MSRAYVALGSNLGDRAGNLRAARAGLEVAASGMRTSKMYRTAPVGGPAGQRAFLNAVAELDVTPPFADPHRLLELLLRIEHRQGRRRRVRWEARTLDLDLLSFKSVVLESESLTLPHPRLLERPFVLVPLAEIAPDWRHPKTAERAADALARLDTSGVEATCLPWHDAAGGR